MVKTAFYLCLLTLPSYLFAQAKKDTLRVYFDIGISSLQLSEQQSIDSLIYYDILQPGKKLGIIGYADYLGSEETNIGLSEARANNIKAYLLSMGMKEADIEIVMGKGEVKRTALNGNTGYQEDRRVDIILGGFKTPPAIKAEKPSKAINLTKSKAGETLRLENVNFIGGSSQWLEESIPVLEQLLAELKEHPTVRIRIEGHVCCLPTSHGRDMDTGGYELSESRAKAVYKYLVANGIDTSRLEYKGFGRSRPLRDPELTPEDQMMNRRVEIRRLSK